MIVKREIFPQHVVTWNGKVQWPARSPDLFESTFFWGTLKVKCAPLNGVPHASNMEAISAIPQEILRRVLGNLKAWLEQCLRNGRRCLSDVI